MFASGVLVPVYADLVALVGVVLVLEIDVLVLELDVLGLELDVEVEVEVVEAILVLDPVAEEVPLLAGM